MHGSVSLREAQTIVATAVAESERRGVKTAVAVVDARGDLVIAVRLDGVTVSALVPSEPGARARIRYEQIATLAAQALDAKENN